MSDEYPSSTTPNNDDLDNFGELYAKHLRIRTLGTGTIRNILVVYEAESCPIQTHELQGKQWVEKWTPLPFPNKNEAIEEVRTLSGKEYVETILKEGT